MEWLLRNGFRTHTFKIFCGKGNNAGDRLAIARLLLHQRITVNLYILETGKSGSEDFPQNLQHLHELLLAVIHYIQTEDTLPKFDTNDVIIDALFGSGLIKPLEVIAAEIVEQLNGT